VRSRGARALALLLVAAAAVSASPAVARAANADVAALQVAMRALGLYPHPVDGITGPWTIEAVRSFQASHGLTVDGIAGPQTLKALGPRGKPLLGKRPMRSGQRGFDVAALQFLLSTRGFGPGGFDGGFGPNTAAAVRRFQTAVGLTVDGIAGPATIRALKSGRVYTELNDPVRFLRPLSVPFTDGFGFIPPGRWHTGLDFPAAKGTTVGAAGRGTVAFAGLNTGGYGNLVVVRHRLGFESWYAHLSTISTSPGQYVVGGTPIGAVGSTGHSTGPHLHFEVRRFGTPIDPLPRLLSSSAARSLRAPARSSRAKGHRRRCRPNADTRHTRDTDPPVARLDRCP
jgi:peptidoglycan hydrolase-like protein with peptidoglycan-binding domain